MKPENILLDFEGHIKLADFGLSRENTKNFEKRYTYCGSPEYMSPEMISRTGHSLSTDSYSLGSLLFELLSGMPPYYDEDQEKMYWRIQNEEVEIPDFFSPEASDLVKGLLAKDSTLRIGNEFISDIKDHPWCAPIHWKKVLKKKIQPPFRPDYNNSNFDAEFLKIEVNHALFTEENFTPPSGDPFIHFNHRVGNTEEIKKNDFFSLEDMSETRNIDTSFSVNSESTVNSKLCYFEESPIDESFSTDKNSRISIANTPRESLSPSKTPYNRFSLPDKEIEASPMKKILQKLFKQAITK